jgi:hypothetical protein
MLFISEIKAHIRTTICWVGAKIIECVKGGPDIVVNAWVKGGVVQLLELNVRHKKAKK